ncbi:MAG: NUDIX hydrolase [Flavobacteriaceae bacterium]
MSFNYIAQLTSKIEEIPKPGLAAQLKMAPPQRFGTKETLIKVPKNVKKAAVMMLLYPKDQQLSFCLIQRTTYDGKHSGQISFPGGKKEEEDIDFWATALRESHEEIGVNPAEIKLITTLSSTYIPPSNFYVYPYLAYTNQRPDFVADEGEVDHVIEVPLSDLLGESAIQNGPITASYTKEVIVPMFVFGSYRVWGATAMILSEAREIIRLAK